MTPELSRFQEAMKRIDQENSHDPNKDFFGGRRYPKELLYSLRMSEWLEKFEPEGSEALRLAARSQHLCRWIRPRSDYPMDRKGYLLWRTELKKFHADKAGAILKEVGYDKATIKRVQSLIQKEKIKVDPESQTLEDVICLVFLESYFADFSVKHDEHKIIGIIQKTWKKMSRRGQEEALKLKLPLEAERIIERAVKEG